MLRSYALNRVRVLIVTSLLTIVFQNLAIGAEDKVAGSSYHEPTNTWFKEYAEKDFSTKEKTALGSYGYDKFVVTLYKFSDINLSDNYYLIHIQNNVETNIQPRLRIKFHFHDGLGKVYPHFVVPVSTNSYIYFGQRFSKFYAGNLFDTIALSNVSVDEIIPQGNSPARLATQ